MILLSLAAMAVAGLVLRAAVDNASLDAVLRFDHHVGPESEIE